jgi:phosphate transport system permease protein
MATAQPTAGVRERVLAASARIRRVKLLDRAATVFITLGGLFIIVAVSFIFVFLFSETLPLFRPAEGSFRTTLALASPAGADARPLALGIDEYQRYVYALFPDARVVFFNASDGAAAREFAIESIRGTTVTSASRSLTGDLLGIGTADGRVALQQVRFRPRYENQKMVDLELELRDQGVFTVDAGKRPVREVAYAENDGRKTVAALTGDAELIVLHAGQDGKEEKRELLTTGEGEQLTRVRLGRSDTLVGATAEGNLYFWELSPETRLSEVRKVSREPLTALEFALGGVSFVVGDQKGNLSAWFRVRLNDDDPQLSLVEAHEYPSQESAITAIAASPRDKTFVTAAEDGSLVVRHLTSERSVIAFPAEGSSVERVLLTPKVDGILAARADGRIAQYTLSNPHPEVSWRALFGKVWYEGYARPEYVWQSTGGTDDFETKFSLVPLVFGTIKGTAYALLFAIPLSILGALYTSQFMHPSIKAKIKPTIEVMAALPSVVIGFIAGLWLAGRVERDVVPVLLMLVLLPAFGTAGFLLWDRLPRRFASKLRPGMELALILPLLLIGGFVAMRIGPWVEASFFAGDFRIWLQNALGLVYDQRNSLVVGLAMGFAVIPIIFTISEDSFSSVPSHLTAASLALGASRWQTAVRVVLPTASPGIFSAVMIGFGRAVGETMIVLMATGNTPVLDWSIFNGMRTLSANIAVEIPEAPYGGTLYRTLFLAALLLFLLTFVANTLAEIVRQRLRERYKAI